MQVKHRLTGVGGQPECAHITGSGALHREKRQKSGNCSLFIGDTEAAGFGFVTSEDEGC